MATVFSKYKYFLPVWFIIMLSACHSSENKFDASGTFESDEVIVSSQLGGELLSFNIEEGDTLSAGKIVGKIDSTDVETTSAGQPSNHYKKKQLMLSRR